MAKSAELKALEKERGRISERIWEIERAAADAESAPYVGRFFKSKNSYSCPKGPQDHWFWYFRVTGTEGRFLTGFTFQRDKFGNVRTERKASLIFESHGFTEITRGEWDFAWAEFLKLLKADEANA